MQLEFDFSGTLVSHKCHIFIENKRKNALKGAKLCQKAKENGQFVMNCPFVAEVTCNMPFINKNT